MTIKLGSIVGCASRTRGWKIWGVCIL